MFATSGNMQVPVYMWAEALSGNVEEIQRGTVVDNAGNVYITGVFFGTVDFDPGAGVASITPSPYGSNAYIAKYDVNGAYQWAINIPINTSYGNNSIAIDATAHLYITGYYSGNVDFNPGAGTATLSSTSGSNDIYIAKFDSDGNYIWAKGIGSTGDDRGNEILIHSSGDILLTGNFNNTVDFDPGAGVSSLTSFGSGDIYIAKYDGSGNYLWAQQIGGAGIDDVRDIALDDAANIFITGNFAGTSDFDPGAGSASVTSAGWGDIFIAKYDATGNYLWAKQMGSTGFDNGTAVSIDTLGNLFITGTFNNTVDFDPGGGVVNYTAALGAGSYFGKFDTDGNYVWVKPLPLNTNNIDILVDYCNNVYVSGNYSNIYAVTIDMDPGAGTASLSVPGTLPPPYYNIFARYDDAGNYLWADVFGRTCYCSVAGYKSSLAIDTSGYIYYSGIFNAPFFGTSTVDFDPGVGTANLTATSSVDNTFFTKYDIGCPLIPLPIIFSSFTGENRDHINYLSWSTLSELNSDYFEIQKSNDGINFIPIGTVKASGNTTESKYYQFTDDADITGTYYYRLKEVDLNNGMQYSDVIQLSDFDDSFTIYPNPTSGMITIYIEESETGKYVIYILNSIGEVVHNSDSFQGGTIDINLNNLPDGVYHILLHPVGNSELSTLHKTILLNK